MEDGTLNLQWLILLVVQLLVGGALVWFAPEKVEGASTLGIAILGSATGQALTAQTKAVR